MRKTVFLSLLAASALSFGVAQQTGGAGQTGGGQTGGATEPGVAGQAGGGSGLILVETREPGSYIADAEGKTLYTLVDDSMQPLPCEGECLTFWPPYTGEASLDEGSTLDASLVGTADTEDGQSQVTYNGYPLYYFAEDQNAGDLNGQAQEGFGGIWYVLSDTGEPLESDPLGENATDDE
jgi:predicted lipoprotein with Yx(FWY)xxD motif